MATIVFVIANHTGHLHSSVKLASDLRGAGHRVVYWTGDLGSARAAAWGFEHENVPFVSLLDRGRSDVEVSAQWSQQLKAARLEGRRLQQRVAAVVPAARELVERWRPDLLVFDPFLLCYYPAFHVHRVAAVVLSTKPLLDADPSVPPYTSGLVPKPSWLGRLQTRLARGLSLLRFARYRIRGGVDRWLVGFTASPQCVLRELSLETHFPLKEQVLQRHVEFDICLRNVPELVLSASEFDLPRAKPLRAHVHYLGPCVALTRHEPVWAWDRVPLRRYLVFCALSTVELGRDQVAMYFLQRVVAAFRDDPEVSLIIAAGDAAAVSMIPCSAPNVRVFGFVPQLQVLSRAHVMITHGGSSSIKECIYKRVPPLVYPGRADQPGNAARVVHHGIGLRGSRLRDTSHQIRSKAMHLIKDASIHAKLAHMHEAFVRYPPVDYARLSDIATRAADWTTVT